MMKASVREYERLNSQNHRAIDKWTLTKAELGFNKKWDFVNGYFGEEIESEPPNSDILAKRAKQGMSAIRRSEGPECLRIDPRKERDNENVYKNAMKYINARMDCKGMEGLDTSDKYETKAYSKRLIDK